MYDQGGLWIALVLLASVFPGTLTKLQRHMLCLPYKGCLDNVTPEILYRRAGSMPLRVGHSGITYSTGAPYRLMFHSWQTHHHCALNFMHHLVLTFQSLTLFVVFMLSFVLPTLPFSVSPCSRRLSLKMSLKRLCPHSPARPDICPTQPGRTCLSAAPLLPAVTCFSSSLGHGPRGSGWDSRTSV